MPAVKQGLYNGRKDQETESHAKPYIVICTVKFFHSKYVWHGVIEGQDGSHKELKSGFPCNFDYSPVVAHADVELALNYSVFKLKRATVALGHKLKGSQLYLKTKTKNWSGKSLI